MWNNSLVVDPCGDEMVRTVGLIHSKSDKVRGWTVERCWNIINGDYIEFGTHVTYKALDALIDHGESSFVKKYEKGLDGIENDSNKKANEREAASYLVSLLCNK